MKFFTSVAALLFPAASTDSMIIHEAVSPISGLYVTDGPINSVACPELIPRLKQPLLAGEIGAFWQNISLGDERPDETMEFSVDGVKKYRATKNGDHFDLFVNDDIVGSCVYGARTPEICTSSAGNRSAREWLVCTLDE